MDILTKQIEKAKKEFRDRFTIHSELFGRTLGTIKSVTNPNKEVDEVEDFLEQSIRESVIAVVSNLRMDPKNFNKEVVVWRDGPEGIIQEIRNQTMGYNQAVIELNSKIDSICKK